MRPAPRCARRRRAPGLRAGTPRRLRCPVRAGGCRWPRWSATGPAAGAGCSTESECTAAAAGSGAASCEDDYAALIAAAHVQLRAPIILIWDNLNVHRSAVMRRFCEAHSDWLTVVQLPAYAPELNATEGVWAHVKRDLGSLLPAPSTSSPPAPKACSSAFSSDLNPSTDSALRLAWPLIRNPGAR